MTNVNLQNTKDAESMVKRALVALRKATPYVNLVGQGYEIGRLYSVTVETDIPYEFIDLLEPLVAKSERAMLVDSKVYPGQFDWKSDTYIKDSAYVSFRF